MLAGNSLLKSCLVTCFICGACSSPLLKELIKSPQESKPAPRFVLGSKSANSKGGEIVIPNVEALFEAEKKEIGYGHNGFVLEINGIPLRSGDKLCSPNQQKDQYFLMRPDGRKYYTVPKDSKKREWVGACNKIWFPRNRNDIDWYEIDAPATNSNFYHSTIEISSCSIIEAENNGDLNKALTMKCFSDHLDKQRNWNPIIIKLQLTSN